MENELTSYDSNNYFYQTITINVKQFCEMHFTKKKLTSLYIFKVQYQKD